MIETVLDEEKKGGFHIQGDTATEKLIWAFNRNSNQIFINF